MGICLDTEQQNGSQVFEQQHQGREAWLNDPNIRPTTPNAGHVKFELPKVPVIFVLGGPGSGKVTHCDNLMQEKRGITHINMTDLLQQYAIGNADMKDFSQLSSKTVTEVLMLEMKMAPAAKTYLVSGYPRSMRDVVEYSEKIQVVSGVILVSWRQKILERQIDYGAKLGHVVLSLAKMELSNFYKNVMPVAEYFDQRGMLYAVNGERNPSEVYKDFRSAVLRILGMKEQTETMAEVKVEPTTMETHRTTAAIVDNNTEYKAPPKGFPPVVWVIGGPGSNKSALCQKAVRQAPPGWVHLSVGRLLRATAEGPTADSKQVRQAISGGDMVPHNVVMQLVESQMRTNMSATGIIMDGFPRDMNQIYDFESKFGQQPHVLLLDCSKLQLGRGRLDDSVAAFRRRLELFREVSLPMLKTLDRENRLTIVDGDTDSLQVQEEFTRVVLQQVERAKRTAGLIMPRIHDLEESPKMNGAIPNGAIFGSEVGTRVPNGNAHYAGNGRVSRNTIRDMYAHVESYPLDSHI